MYSFEFSFLGHTSMQCSEATRCKSTGKGSKAGSLQHEARWLASPSTPPQEYLTLDHLLCNRPQHDGVGGLELVDGPSLSGGDHCNLNVHSVAAWTLSMALLQTAYAQGWSCWFARRRLQAHRTPPCRSRAPGACMHAMNSDHGAGS
eukprot:TRINITY_DN1836_c0_g1_i10.p3 TRINITY_DN1836_c0_g1~~TRINITY_DN1836_c0_g1_i10.p3  ORF type:complete len:147 (-),score=8.74 TRINITY_DN1836_c0_g1_i10:53-493(-)